MNALQSPRHRSPWALARALALALAVLLLGGWGQVHRVLHPGVPTLSAAERPAQAAPAGLAHDEGGSLCQLLDHLSHGCGLPTVLALALPLAPPLAPLPLLAQRAPSFTLLAFEARAPPTRH